MKLKKLVMLSSFLVLTILFVCVSVYAYNAFSYKNVSKSGWLSITALSNNYFLDDGYINASDRVYRPGISLKTMYTTNDVSWRVTASGSASQGGYASAYVDGLDSGGLFQSAYSSATHP